MKDATDITVVLDRSGSMSTMVYHLTSAFSEFLTQQKALPQEATYTLIQFDDKYDVVCEGINLQDAQELMLMPRAMTALYDAIGKTIDRTGKRLESLPPDQRPSKVLFLILTDGLENASREYTKEKIKEMIEHQRTVYSWEFIFLGANQDAIEVGTGLGISKGSTMSFDPNAIHATYCSVGNAVSGYRKTGEVANFTDEDRNKAMDGNP